MRLLVLPAARADLLGIRRFGLRRWGAAQADAYAHKLRSRLEALASGLLSGTSAEERAAGLRRLVAESHVVWFRVEGGRVLIVRVLHQSQDPGRHLGP